MGLEGDASELLDLVRSAEQGAFVSTTPSGNPVPVATFVEEEFVDVGDDATDATPSTPLRLPTPGQMQGRAPVARAAPTIAPAGAATPPAVGIVILLALAIGILAVLAR